ncbi:MAG: hypothetical protein EOP14_04505 [Pseudomonas sp.]|nr:MAG: hypothetical protein EOP14_04505 [Pseudomonas sp.]
MATYAILRAQKLKSSIAVHRSLKHAFRAQDTPNADRDRISDNTHIGASSVSEAMAAFTSRLPDKHRKDAVLAIEYLITASPEAMGSKERCHQDAYFRDALKWLQDKHGRENVTYAGIHRDETTPHMYAYVVPRVGEKLNCRHFLGGAQALSQMQTDFAQQVGIKHGLERGLEGSKARHTTIGQYYARVNGKTPPAPAVDVPDPSLSDRLNPRAYGEKVAQSVVEQLRPAWQVLSAKARETDLAKQQAKEARAAFKDQDERLKPLVNALRPLNQEERQKFVKEALAVGEKIASSRRETAQAKIQQQEKARRSRGTDRSR